MGSGAGVKALRNSLSALQRIDRLEANEAIATANLMKVMEAVNGAFARQTEKSSTLEGVINAIVEVLDKTTSKLVETGALPVTPGTVLETLKAHIAIRQAAQVESDKAAIAGLAENGSLVVTDMVAEDSLIVGEESTGAAGGAGWQQMEFSNVKPEFQPLLIGKHVGDSVQLGPHTLVVTEIYKIVEKVEVPSASEAPVAAPAPADENVAPVCYVAQAPFAEAPEQDAQFVRGTDADGNSINVQVPESDAYNTVGYSEPA